MGKVSLIIDNKMLEKLADNRILVSQLLAY